MSIYKRILLGVELHPFHDAYTTQKAVALAKESNATLYVLHAYEGITDFAAKALELQDVAAAEKKLLDTTQKAMDELEGEYGIFKEQLLIQRGSAKTLIVEYAKKLNADLIIVGSGTRPGAGALIGSTAQWVLQNAHCDVLTLRLKV
jgi:nucleotide-binding universal stress UspA family protein